MDECKKKPRCAWGECDGQSLPSDPNDYCPTGFIFRPDYCDCEPENGTGGVYLIGSSGNFSYTDGAQDPPSRLMTLDNYFDQEGRWVEEKFSLNTNSTWEAGVCNSGTNVYDPACLNYQGVFSASKSNICSGGGPYWVNYQKVFFVNGEYDRFLYSGGFQAAAGTQCGAPVGTAVSITLEIRALDPPV